MAKLHELLAVEGNLKAQADKTRTELSNTFEKKRNLFFETITTYQPNQDGAPSVTEAQLDIQSTVPQELRWITPFLVKALDAAYQVDEGNTQARADVVLENGNVIAEQVPATALLQLEKRVKEIHDFVMTIPTLDPVRGFTADPTRGDGIYKARDTVRPRTNKVLKWVTLAPPTDKHPAQVKDYMEDVVIGNVTVQEWSGLITPAEKGRILERVEDLSRAVKRARARANEVQVDTDTKKIGLKLLKHVFAGYI